MSDSPECPHSKAILKRIELETRGMDREEMSRYLGAHVAIGIAFMTGALGKRFVNDFIMAATIASSQGLDTFDKKGSDLKLALPREPKKN